MSRGPAYGVAMLNATMVNAAAVNVFRRVFTRKGRESARISLFEMSVKYKRNSPVNHETVHFAGPAAAGALKILH
jgi:hypothetical protein